jgi:predicted acetyltransferase
LAARVEAGWLGGVPALLLPRIAAHRSFLDAMAEFRAEGRGAPDDDSALGTHMRRLERTWHDPAVFASYVDSLLADSLEETPRAADWVPCTTWWWGEDEAYVGRVALRHRLTPGLSERGGHIGYDVRPSARRRGHATAMLQAVLPRAAELGIAHALLTCDSGNVGSRTVIETCGGVFEDERAGTLRYWVPTGRTRRA